MSDPNDKDVLINQKAGDVVQYCIKTGYLPDSLQTEDHISAFHNMLTGMMADFLEGLEKQNTVAVDRLDLVQKMDFDDPSFDSLNDPLIMQEFYSMAALSLTSYNCAVNLVEFLEPLETPHRGRPLTHDVLGQVIRGVVAIDRAVGSKDQGRSVYPQIYPGKTFENDTDFIQYIDNFVNSVIAEVDEILNQEQPPQFFSPGD